MEEVLLSSLAGERTTESSEILANQADYVVFEEKDESSETRGFQTGLL